MLFIASCMLITFSSVQAATGNEILAQINSSDVAENLRAYAYIEGVVETEDVHFALRAMQTPLFNDFQKIKGGFVCIPDGVTKLQVFDLVKKHLENSPEQRHKMASILIRNTLWRTWPCKT